MPRRNHDEFEYLDEVLLDIHDLVSDLGDTLKTLPETVQGAVKQALELKPLGVVSEVAGGASETLDHAGDAAQTISEAVKDAVRAPLEAVADATEATQQKISSNMDKLKRLKVR